MSLFHRTHDEEKVGRDRHDDRDGDGQRTTDRDRHTGGTDTEVLEHEDREAVGAHERGRHLETRTETLVVDDEAAHDRFGGLNWGSAFFGWLVAIGMTVLLAGIVGAIASAVGATTGFSLDEAEREAATVGVAGAIGLGVEVGLAYLAGGYVAGRMSRFDGARQGVGVWVVGLVVMAVSAVVGWIAGSEFNAFDRLNLPELELSISGDAAAVGGVITGIVILVLTLLMAMAGGRLGERYHHRVDESRYV